MAITCEYLRILALIGKRVKSVEHLLFCNHFPDFARCQLTSIGNDFNVILTERERESLLISRDHLSTFTFRTI